MSEPGSEVDVEVERAEELSPRRSRRILAIGIGGVLLVAILAGPRPTFDERWVEPQLPEDLVEYLRSSEAEVPNLREGDQKEIVWYDPIASPGMAAAGVSAGSRTLYSVVYLHGFSADRHEIEPVVTDLARELRANLYFARLTGHGRDPQGMADGSVAAWLDDTAEAVAIGSRIGERVVLVGTSTGATLAAWAANRPEAADRLAATVLISPNFQPKDRQSLILLWPWGGPIARLVEGRERCWEAANPRQERHWTTCYPTEALLPMMAVADGVRRTDFSRLSVPTLVLYSPFDRVVETDVTLQVVARWPRERLRVIAQDRTTDRGQHVLAGDILAPSSNAVILRHITDFLAEFAGRP